MADRRPTVRLPMVVLQGVLGHGGPPPRGGATTVGFRWEAGEAVGGWHGGGGQAVEGGGGGVERTFARSHSLTLTSTLQQSQSLCSRVLVLLSQRRLVRLRLLCCSMRALRQAYCLLRVVALLLSTLAV